MAKLVWIFLLAVACTPTRAQTAPMRMHRDFTAEEERIFVKDAKRWCRAIPEACPEVIVNYEGNAHNVVRMEGPSPRRNGVAFPGQSFRNRMWLYGDDMNAAHFERVVLHEMGHWLGAQEDAHPINGRALNETVGPDITNCINAADIRAVCEGRGGCRGPTYPDCD